MGVVNLMAKTYSTLKCDHIDENRLANLQKRRLRRLLRHAAANSEFYHELLREVDTVKCQLKDLPIVKKSTMMDNFDRFVTDKRLKLSEIQCWMRDKNNDGKRYLDDFIPIYSSGSTGERALMVYHRKALEQIQASLFARSSLMNEKPAVYNFAKMVALLLLGKKIRIAVIGHPRGNVCVLFKNLSPLHRLFAKIKIISSLIPIHRIVEELNEFQPDCLISYSFLISLLAQEQLAGRLNISFNRQASFLTGSGELLTVDTQKLAEKAWHKKIHNVYGAVECYTLASSCQKLDHLHVMSNLCILEVVDRDYNPVVQGQYGEKVLLTNLFNFTQPIIRYEIEDVVGYANQKCECGSSFPNLLPVQGRTTDFMYFENPCGRYKKIHPYHLLVPLFYLNDLRQYQIVQSARNELTFYYVPQKAEVEIEPQVTHTLEEALAQAGLEGKVKLKLKRVDCIPRDKNTGKLKMIKSMKPPAHIDAVP